MQSLNKITGAPVPSWPQGWAELPKDVLHSIIPLLGSFLDLFAFDDTCKPWHAALASYPHKAKLCTLLPPLLVRPNAGVSAPGLPSSSDGHRLHTCQVIDPANPEITTLRCQIPQITLEMTYFLSGNEENTCLLGFSYGQMICGRSRDCLIIDVFTGARLSTPRLPFRKDIFYCGMLTAPLTSPNSHLLISISSKSNQYLLDWLVGSASWSKLRCDDARIDQIVDFNGQFIAMDLTERLYRVSLAPNLGLQEIATVWRDGFRFPDPWFGTSPGIRLPSPWLVVCGDMLLVVCFNNVLSRPPPVRHRAYRLNMLTNPANWVEVERIENYTIFVGPDDRSSSLSCTSPGQWGGRSNCMYFAFDIEPKSTHDIKRRFWSMHGLGNEANAAWVRTTDRPRVFKRTTHDQLQPFWVYPSMFYQRTTETTSLEN